MPKWYFLLTGLAFLALSILALSVWDMYFAAWFWALIASFKITVFGMAWAEERGL